MFPYGPHNLDRAGGKAGLGICPKGKQGAENKHRASGHQLFQSSIVPPTGDMDRMIDSADGSSQVASASLYGSILHGLP